MTIFAKIIIASVAESLVSFGASLAVIVNEKKVRNFVHWFISFAVGALLGVVFFDLMPETFEFIGAEKALPWILAGFLLFFVLEKFLFWFHRHEHKHEASGNAGYLVSVGDAIHNFIDGVVIALSFAADARLGFVTTIAILLHEVPQEVGDFAVLLHSGFSKRKALFYNVFVSLSTIAGAVVGYYLPIQEQVLGILLAVVAGNFLYLAAADLIPELHHNHRSSSSVVQVLLIGVGVLLVYTVGIFFHE